MSKYQKRGLITSNMRVLRKKRAHTKKHRILAQRTNLEEAFYLYSA